MEHWKNKSLENIVEFIEGIGWVTEEWKSISGYQGLYEISTFGRIKSLKRKNRLTDKIFSIQKQPAGYLKAKLSNNSATKYLFVHVLVAIAYIENIKNKPQVNHKKGIKTDNRYFELEWCTQSENAIHASENNLLHPPSGENNWKSFLTNTQVLELVNSKERNCVLAKI